MGACQSFTQWAMKFEPGTGHSPESARGMKDKDFELNPWAEERRKDEEQDKGWLDNPANIARPFETGW